MFSLNGAYVYLKRIFDIVASIFILMVSFPVISLGMFCVWFVDGGSPVYSASRIGISGKKFTMYKIRTMVLNAEKSHVDTTSKDDIRILPVGYVLRRFKIDELPQAFNVLKGDMSMVGPRPNVNREVSIYTKVEMGLLSVRPGITDFSSIVFSDLGEIMSKYEDANIAYNQLIRPWKSRLSLFYIEHRSFVLDIKILACTAISVVSHTIARNLVKGILIGLGCDEKIISVVDRKEELTPHAPPGSKKIVTDRRV
jgi:lipopolysaccharide/colanic/teichoic acid biosynthesis glycosyltransferase